MAMDSDCFISKMKSLASCQISPDEWVSWWNENAESLEGFLNRGEFLRIKPSLRKSLWIPILGSQKGAIKYLQDRGIDCPISSDYQENFEKELADSVRKEEERQKQRLEGLKAELPLFFEKYPKFAKSLESVFFEGDTIGKPVAVCDLDLFEEQSKIRIPQELREFFAIVSEISVEGIHIGFDELDDIVLLNKKYCRLGEFWAQADGDLLLFDPDEDNDTLHAYYYAHEDDRIDLLTESLFDLLEDEFASYLKDD